MTQGLPTSSRLERLRSGLAAEGRLAVEANSDPRQGCW